MRRGSRRVAAAVAVALAGAGTGMIRGAGASR